MHNGDLNLLAGTNQTLEAWVGELNMDHESPQMTQDAPGWPPCDHGLRP